MIITKHLLYFMILSLCGWIYETAVMTIIEKKWDNRGFLIGPAIPIYGVGATLIGIIKEIADYNNINYDIIQVFFIAFIGSAILEYSVHYSLEKIFHAYWWDYSTAPLNINGRICLPASIGFGLAGIFVVYYAFPFVVEITNRINPIVIELIVTLSVIAMTADTTMTIVLLSNFEEKIKQSEEIMNLNIGRRVNSAFETVEDLTTNTYISKVVSLMKIPQKLVLKKIKGFKGYKLGVSTKLNNALSIIKNKNLGDKENGKEENDIKKSTN